MLLRSTLAPTVLLVSFFLFSSGVGSAQAPIVQAGLRVEPPLTHTKRLRLRLARYANGRHQNGQRLQVFCQRRRVSSPSDGFETQVGGGPVCRSYYTEFPLGVSWQPATLNRLTITYSPCGDSGFISL